MNSGIIENSIINGKGTNPQIISITSGKGGVGKSSISVNLAILLQQMKARVLLIDADVHLGSIDLILGMRPTYSIANVLTNEVGLQDAIITTPEGIDVLPASSAVPELMEIEDVILRKLSENFAAYELNYDVIIIDTGAGIAKMVISFVLAGDKVLLIVTPDPSSIADAYALIKVIKHAKNSMPIMMISNMVKSYEEGDTLFKKMNLMSKKFLKTEIEFGGSILKEDLISNSVKTQKPFVLEHPYSTATKSLRSIKHKLLNMSVLPETKENNFFCRLITNRKISPEIIT